ncbi:MAG: hypothetical protein V1859_07740 [archaeon]
MLFDLKEIEKRLYPATIAGFPGIACDAFFSALFSANSILTFVLRLYSSLSLSLRSALYSSSWHGYPLRILLWSWIIFGTTLVISFSCILNSVDISFLIISPAFLVSSGNILRWSQFLHCQEPSG